MRLSITRATREDAAVLAEILTQAMRYKLSLDDKAWGIKPYTAEELDGRISKDLLYAARINDELVGTLMFLLEDKLVWGEQPPVAAYVHQLAIKDGYRGQGIGESLLSWAEQKAGRKGRTLLRVDAPQQNTGLRKYYEKLGFKWVGYREIRTPHTTYMAALYERPIVDRPDS